MEGRVVVTTKDDGSAPEDAGPRLPPILPDAPQPSSSPLHTSAKEGLEKVQADYLYWTGRLTDLSFHLSLAVIAAHWAVFKDVESLRGCTAALLSISLVIVSVAVSLGGAFCMGELHRRRVECAEANPTAWEREFQESLGTSNPWPSTKLIDSLGWWLRVCRVVLPILASALFLVALCCA